MVESIQHPISGPEACSAFRHGFKPLLSTGYEGPAARDEFEHLDVLVKAAKEAEDLLRVIAGSSGDDSPRRRNEGGHTRDNKCRLPPWLPGTSKWQCASMCPATWWLTRQSG
jgi:hypothetical protein